MPMLPAASRRLAPAFSRAPALLASTCVTALLLGSPTQAGQTVTPSTPQMTVSNAAGNKTTSIVITGTSVSGAVTNAGTITPGKANVGLGTEAILVTNSTIGAGITNSGTINTVPANNLGQGVGTVGNGVSNAAGASIVATGGVNSFGVQIVGSTITNGVTNAGSINLAALASQGTTIYKNAIVADPPLTGDFAKVATPNLLFTASVSPDATTPNALDASLTL